MIDTHRLDEMSRIDITKVDKDALVDLTSVQVDADAPVGVRFKQIVDQLQNPYAFRVGEVAVKIEFSPDGKPLSDAVAYYLTSLKDNT